MKKDIEIAHSTQLLPIDEVAASLGIGSDSLEHYGKHSAKLPLSLIDDRRRGKLILVTAITATKAGIGKTTVSIGLALGLNAIGRKACVALREPSLGPCFGMKGGAAGGGYAQVLPMERINLHFTGDFHAITAAHNMVSALLDNYLYQHAAEGFGLKEVTWRRVLDVNDRSLRSIVTGLGPATNGIPAQAGFDITPASELMAILCLASSLDDLRQRVGRIILGYRYDGSAFRADITARALMERDKKRLYGGVTYAPGHSVTGFVGGSFHGIDLSYSYEANTSGMGFGAGQHEVTLGYRLELNLGKKGRNLHRSVRYL